MLVDAPIAETRWARVSGTARKTWRRLRGAELTPGRAAGSVALGLFVGALPLYGIQAWICLAVALPFGLDFPAAFVRRFIFGGASLVLLMGLGFALYVYTSLHWSYADGDRSGNLQKFSRKGWLCKTYEGELAMSYAPGLAPTMWQFSVRNEEVAAKINQALGHQVVLHYNEHRGIPTDCFGETGYYVDAVRIVE